MDKTPYDVRRQLMLTANPQDIEEFCYVDKLSASICNNQGFWMEKGQRDYPYQGITTHEQYLEHIRLMSTSRTFDELYTRMVKNTNNERISIQKMLTQGQNRRLPKYMKGNFSKMLAASWKPGSSQSIYDQIEFAYSHSDQIVDLVRAQSFSFSFIKRLLRASRPLVEWVMFNENGSIARHIKQDMPRSLRGDNWPETMLAYLIYIQADPSMIRELYASLGVAIPYYVADELFIMVNGDLEQKLLIIDVTKPRGSSY